MTDKPRPGAWRLIESAPKDETLIIIGDNRIGEWVLTARFEDGRWHTPDGLSYHVDGFTHWMPIDEMPEIDGND